MKITNSLHPSLLERDVRGLVFDLDGTLIDSAADIISALRTAFEQTGIGRLPDDYFPDNLHGTSEGIMRSIAADMGWTLPDYEALRACYITVYSARNHRLTRLYKHVDTVLGSWRSTGLPMAICTNKVQSVALTALRKTGIDGWFNVVSGADTWAAAKPSPIPLLETIRSMGLQPNECLYFGDTSTDAACAEAAGVRFVLHESGYGDTELACLPRYYSFRDWYELLSDEPVAAQAGT